MTGAQALEKILTTVEDLKATISTLETSVKLIEANIKILNNRAGGILREQQTTRTPIDSVPATLPLQSAQPTRGRQLVADTSQQIAQLPTQDTVPANAIVYKKVFGRLIDGNKEAISGALVKVFDKNNEVCATTETDPVGYWEVMTRPGKYVAEYTKAGFKTANKTFEVSKTAKETEVR